MGTSDKTIVTSDQPSPQEIRVTAPAPSQARGEVSCHQKKNLVVTKTPFSCHQNDLVVTKILNVLQLAPRKHHLGFGDN